MSVMKITIKNFEVEISVKEIVLMIFILKLLF